MAKYSKKTTKTPAKKRTAKKKAVSKKVTAKKATTKKKSIFPKATPKKKPAAKKNAATKKTVSKKRTAIKAAVKKKPVPKKTAVKKAAPKKKIALKKKTIPQKIVSKTRVTEQVTDVKDTLRNLTEDSVIQPDAAEEREPERDLKNDSQQDFTSTGQEEETNTELTPWVKVEEHINIDEHDKAEDIVKPNEEKAFDKFKPKATAPDKKLHFSSKPKGSMKPAGKKPLWN